MTTTTDRYGNALRELGDAFIRHLMTCRGARRSLGRAAGRVMGRAA